MLVEVKVRLGEQMLQQTFTTTERTLLCVLMGFSNFGRFHRVKVKKELMKRRAEEVEKGNRKGMDVRKEGRK